MKPGDELTFETIRNFRDLGGYEAAGGRHVKYGLILRGPALCELSESDRRKVDSMGIKTIMDFRAESESSHNPEYIPAGAEYFRQCASIDRHGNEIDFSPGAIEKISHKFVTLFRLIRGTVTNDVYNCMPFNNPAFRKMFSLLEEERTPLYFHCAAGKDRTGVAAMLILMAFGADRKTALDDYELTNVYYKDRIDAAMKKYRWLVKHSSMARYRFTAGAGVSRMVADQMIDLVIQKYGTFENYMEQEYGMDRTRLERFRNLYLD